MGGAVLWHMDRVGTPTAWGSGSRRHSVLRTVIGVLSSALAAGVSRVTP